MREGEGEGSKERKRETGALGSLAGDHCQGSKYKMLWVINSSHLYLQTSCLGVTWTILGFHSARKANLRPSAIGPRPLALTATTSVFSTVCRKRKWNHENSLSKVEDWTKGMLCGCSSYPHVLHLFLIIPTSSLCVSRLSFPPVPVFRVWIIMFEFRPGCLFPTVTTLP